MVACEPTTRSAAQVRLLRNQGMERQYENEVVGFNTRMTDIHAAIGRVQLTKVDAWTETRQRERRVPRRAPRAASDVPPVADGATHVYHQYTIRVPEDRDGLVQRAARGAQRRLAACTTRSPTTGSVAAHFAPGLDLPETERAAREVLSLPVHPSLSAGRPRAHRRPRSTPSPGRAPDGATLRAGLIGLGMMGRHHARVLRDARRRRAGRRRRPRRRPARRRRRSLPVLPDVDALIAAGIDVAVVAVPTGFHEEVALALAAAGVHTLVEKPIAETRRGRRAARRGLRGRRAWSARSAHRALQPRAASACATRLEDGRARRGLPDHHARQGPFPARIADVGVVKDLATHDIDLTAWVAERRTRAVSAQTAHQSGREHEDTGRRPDGWPTASSSTTSSTGCRR